MRNINIDVSNHNCVCNICQPQPTQKVTIQTVYYLGGIHEKFDKR